MVVTGIVDQNVHSPVLRRNRVVGCLDGLVGFHVGLDGAESARGVGVFCLDGLDSGSSLVEVTAAHQNLIGFAGSAEGFDGFEAQTGVAACDEEDCLRHVSALSVGFQGQDLQLIEWQGM